MAYAKKQTWDSGTAPLKEGDTAEKVLEYTENNYEELSPVINGGLEDLNFSPSAGIHESKIVGAVSNHPHFAGTNLGEAVIGDSQLNWDRDGVLLMRTFRPGMKVLWGLTPPITARKTDAMTYGYPNNVVVRVPFSTPDGQAAPFSAGAVVHVVVTPHVPPGTNDDSAVEYFDGVNYLVVGVDNKGFDLWVCTEYIAGGIYLFTYAAIGWEVI